MNILSPIIEILLITVFFYYLLTSLRGTRGAGIFKGLIFISVILFLLVAMLAKFLELSRIHYILRQWFLPIVIFALIIIFQPELRRALLRLGQSRLFNPFLRGKSKVINEIVDAVINLARDHTGALIAIERETGLKPYVESGTGLDAEVSSELIRTIFYPGSALHDGAIIIKDDRIIAASCMFPLTDDPDVSRVLGTRHRAALGITEESDAISLVVSEETGNISLVHKGRINRGFKPEELKKKLTGLLGEEVSESEARTASVGAKENEGSVRSP